MVYKHRMKNGKIRKYSSKQAYENSMKGMFAQGYQSNPRMRHQKTIQLSSKDKEYATRFIRRARRKKGRPISRRVSHSNQTLPPNNIRIRLKSFAKKNLIDPKYLYYVLQHKQMQGEFGQQARGTQARQFLKKSDIENIKLAVDSGAVGVLEYNLGELADIIVDAKDYQPDDIVLARVHDTKKVGKPYFVDTNRIIHSVSSKQTQKQIQARIEKLKGEKIDSSEYSGEYPDIPSKPKPKRTYHEKNETKQKIYSLLKEEEKPLTMEQIKERTGLSKESLKYGITALKQKKQIQDYPNLLDVRKKLYTTSSKRPTISQQ